MQAQLRYRPGLSGILFWTSSCSAQTFPSTTQAAPYTHAAQ